MIAMLNSVLLSALIALGAQAPTQTTPRALLERGALAEEHQRDFAGAQKLYEQAEAAAKAAGDAKTAAEASAAKERVLARQGKGQGPQAEHDAAVQTQLRNRALEFLFKAQNDLPSFENISRAAQQLVDLGPGIVDLLALSLTDSISEDRMHKPPHVPNVAARALANMRTPEADRALIAAYDSADPTIRKAVVDAAMAERFLDLSLRAVNDPVASIRDLVTTRLLNVAEPRAVEAMVALMGPNTTRPDMRQAAAGWLFKNTPTRLLDIAFDAARPLDQRSAALEQITGKVSCSFATDLLRRTRAVPSSDDQILKLARAALPRTHLPQAPSSSPERVALERELAKVEDPALDSWAVSWLAALNPADALPALRKALERRRGAANKEDLERLMSAIDLAWRGGEAKRDLETWTAIALACDANWQSVLWNGNQRSVQSHIWNRCAQLEPSEAFATWVRIWRQIPESHRRDYAGELAGRIEAPGSSSRWLQPVGDEAYDLIDFMLASGKSSLARAALVAAKASASPRFIASAVAAHCSNDADAGPYLQSIATTAPDAITASLHAELGKRLDELNFDSVMGYRAIDLLEALPSDAHLALWERLWAATTHRPARELLLNHLARSNPKSPQHGALLVKLYPTIEAERPESRTDALHRFRDDLVEAALPILEREIRNPDGEVRAAAMEAAEAFRKHREAVAEFDAWRKAVTVEASTVAELSKLLESSNRDVVLGAVKALAILRARPALPTLVKLLERDDKELRAAVQSALETIGGS